MFKTCVAIKFVDDDDDDDDMCNQLLIINYLITTRPSQKTAPDEPTRWLVTSARVALDPSASGLPVSK